MILFVMLVLALPLAAAQPAGPDLGPYGPERCMRRAEIINAALAPCRYWSDDDEERDRKFFKDSPVLAAMENGWGQVLKDLLALGENPNQPSNVEFYELRYPLFHAAENCPMRIPLLLHYGANAKITLPDGAKTEYIDLPKGCGVLDVVMRSFWVNDVRTKKAIDALIQHGVPEPIPSDDFVEHATYKYIQARFKAHYEELGKKQNAETEKKSKK